MLNRLGADGAPGRAALEAFRLLCMGGAEWFGGKFMFLLGA